MPPNQTYQDLYFGNLFDIWFGDIVEEHFKFNKSQVKETFMQGGYYRHDFANTSVSLLALNSMYMCVENQHRTEIAS